MNIQQEYYLEHKSELFKNYISLVSLFNQQFNKENVECKLLFDENSLIQSLDVNLTIEENIESFANAEMFKTQITIYFPGKTIITNEREESHEIYDVFIRFNTTIGGLLLPNCNSQITLARTTFTDKELLTGYVHSHSSKIYRNEKIIDFRKCCLGSGPLFHTCNSLTTFFDINEWLGFCAELKTYIQVESIKGGPYARIKYIKNVEYQTRFVDYKIKQLNNDLQLQSNIMRSFYLYFKDLNNIDVYLKIKNILDCLYHINGNFYTFDSFDSLDSKYVLKVSKTLYENNFDEHAFVEGKYNSSENIILLKDNEDYVNNLEDFDDYHETLLFKNEEIPLKIIKTITLQDMNTYINILNRDWYTGLLKYFLLKKNNIEI